MGLDLLLARLQHWQDFVASESEDTSFAPLITPLAGLAARWRRLQLAGWTRTIDSVLQDEWKRAAQHWHHLHTLLVGSSESKALADVLPVVEEFLQSSTLGQFDARLDLLAVFGGHCGALAAAEGGGGGGGGWRALEVGLGNIAAYYAQHQAAVQAELNKALAPTRKELRVRIIV